MEIQGPGGREAAYKREVVEGAKIFEKSFEGYAKSKLPPQRKEYKDSMNLALQAMQDAMQALMSKELLKEKDQLSKDYQKYLSEPTAANAQKVKNDLNVIKKTA